MVGLNSSKSSNYSYSDTSVWTTTDVHKEAIINYNWIKIISYIFFRKKKIVGDELYILYVVSYMRYYNDADRGDVQKGSAEIFFRKVKFWKEDGEEEAPPVFVGFSFSTKNCYVIFYFLLVATLRVPLLLQTCYTTRNFK